MNHSKINLVDTSESFFCELCSLDFSDRNEKEEHTWSMLHNTNLNKRKGRGCLHKCSLCKREFVGLLAFTSHLHDEEHRDKLYTWRKQSQPQDTTAQNRHVDKNAPPAARKREQGVTRRSRRTADTRVPPNKYHWTSATYFKGKIQQEEQGSHLKEKQTSNSDFAKLDLAHSSVLWFSDSGNSRHSDSSEGGTTTDKYHGKNVSSSTQDLSWQNETSNVPISPTPLTSQKSSFSFDGKPVKDYQANLRIRQEEAARSERHRELASNVPSPTTLTSQKSSFNFDGKPVKNYHATLRVRQEEAAQSERHRELTSNDPSPTTLTSQKSSFNFDGKPVKNYQATLRVRQEEAAQSERHRELTSNDPSPTTLTSQKSSFNFDGKPVKNYQATLRVRQEEAARSERHRELMRRRHSGHSEHSYTSEPTNNSLRNNDQERSEASQFGCGGKTNHQEEKQPDSEPQKQQQQPPRDSGFNASMNSDRSETSISLDTPGSEKSSRKGRPRKVAKHRTSSGEFRAKYRSQPSEKSTRVHVKVECDSVFSKDTRQHRDSSHLSVSDERQSNETRAEVRSVGLRDPEAAQQCQTSLYKETFMACKETDSTTSPINLSTLSFESTNSQRIQEEALRGLLGVKKEPGTESVDHGMWLSSVKVKQEPCSAECTSSSDTQVYTSKSVLLQQQCRFVHIDGVRCGATALENYCSYHQNTEQEASISSIHDYKADPTREIDLSLTLDRIGDLQAAVTPESSIRTINLSDTVAQPAGRSVFERNTGPRESDSTDPTRQSGLKEASSQVKDTARGRKLPHKVLGFNPKRLAHPGGDLPKMLAFGSLSTGLPAVESMQSQNHHTRESNRGTGQLGSTVTDTSKVGAESSVGMIDLSFSSQFLSLPYDFQQPSSVGMADSNPKPRHPFGMSSHSSKVGKSSFELPIHPEPRLSPAEGVATGFDQGRSAPQFLNLPQRAHSVSPALRDHLSTNSPSPSHLTVDLSRFNLPAPVRRVLAARFMAQKHSESGEDSATNVSSVPQMSVDEPRFRLSSAERVKQRRDSEASRKALYTPGRLRLQRSASLDSRPNRLEALQRESDTLLSAGHKEARKASSVFSKQGGYNCKERSDIPQETSLRSGVSTSVHSLQSTVMASGLPTSSPTRERAARSLETHGMIDLSSVTYLQAAGEISKKTKDKQIEISSGQSLDEDATSDTVKETQVMQLGDSFHSDAENLRTSGPSQVAFKRKRLPSIDEAASSMSSVKKMRSLEENNQGAILSYAAGVNIQELLTIEQEEERQIGALSQVQSRLKDVRGKIQKLCTVLDSLHAEENSITIQMSQLRTERLRLLQSALYEQRTPSSENIQSLIGGSPVISTSAASPLQPVVRSGDGDAEVSSVCDYTFPTPLSDRSTAKELLRKVDGDADLAPLDEYSFHDSERSTPQERAAIRMDADMSSLGDRKPSAVGHTSIEESCPLREDTAVESLSEGAERAVPRPVGETGTDHEAQAMEVCSDSADGGQDGCIPVQCEEQRDGSRVGQRPPEKQIHRMRFGRLLNQTRASLKPAFDTVSPEDRGAVGRSLQTEEARGSLLMQPRAVPRESRFLWRRSSERNTGNSAEVGEGDETEVARLTRRHRKRVLWNAKQQAKSSPPKRHSLLETRASNTLTLSKQKLQSARDNMIRWRKQSEGLVENPGASAPTGTRTAGQRVQVASHLKTTKELKKSSLFKMVRKGSSEGSKSKKRKRRRHHSKRGHMNIGDDPTNVATLELVLNNCVEAGAVNMAQNVTNLRGTSSRSTAVPHNEISSSTAVTVMKASSSSSTVSWRRPSSSETPVTQKGASSSNTTVLQKGPSSSSTTVLQKGPSSSNTTVLQKGPSSSRTTVLQKGPSWSSTNVPQKGPSSSSTTVLQKGPSSSSTTVLHKGPSSSRTTEPQKDVLSNSSKSTLEAEGTAEDRILKLRSTSDTVNPVKCKQEDYSSVINEVPTRDAGNELATPNQLSIPSAVESFKEHILRKGKDSKALIGQIAMAFQGQKCHSGAVCGLKVSGNHLFTCSTDKTSKAFDLQTGKIVKTYLGHHQGVNCLEISDEGSRLFTGSNDQTVRSYNMKTCACTHKFTFDGRVMCLHMAFDLLFVGLSTGVVACIDLKSNRCLERLHCHEPRGVSCLATATEGQRKLLCTGSFDSTVTITDYKSGLLLRTLKDHELTVLCLQVVENVIYSGSADKRVQAHNLNTGELLRSYDGHNKSVSGLQIVGRVLVTSCLDKLIRCYDLMSAELLQVYGGQSDMLFSVHMANGRIFSGARDGSVSCVKLDLRIYHPCKWKSCSLNFGIVSHLKSHIRESHVVPEGTMGTCHWVKCQQKFSQEDDITVVLEHILSHADASQTRSPS